MSDLLRTENEASPTQLGMETEQEDELAKGDHLKGAQDKPTYSPQEIEQRMALRLQHLAKFENSLQEKRENGQGNDGNNEAEGNQQTWREYWQQVEKDLDYEV